MMVERKKSASETRALAVRLDVVAGLPRQARGSRLRAHGHRSLFVACAASHNATVNYISLIDHLCSTWKLQGCQEMENL
jgi:hypothetical protein